MASRRAVILGAIIGITAAILLLLLFVGSPPRKVGYSYKPLPGFRHGIHATVRHGTHGEFLLWSLLTLGIVIISASWKLRSVRRRNKISRDLFPKEWFEAAKRHPLTRRIAEANDLYDEKVTMREEVMTVAFGFGFWVLLMGFLFIVFSLTEVFLD